LQEKTLTVDRNLTTVPVMKRNQAHQVLHPQLRLYENSAKGEAVVAGFDLEAVQKYAFLLVVQGYVPVDDDWSLMEHRATGVQGHFRKLSFIKQIHQ
jgi:hypothetical protein